MVKDAGTKWQLCFLYTGAINVTSDLDDFGVLIKSRINFGNSFIADWSFITSTLHKILVIKSRRMAWVRHVERMER
jgi:hypothetical protein